jgi:ribulose-phosphate 3-epimerase
MSIEVLPAIIPESYEDLTCKMSQVKGIVKLVQVDVCDGRFVPSKSWPYVGDYEGHFEKITTEEEGFPFWENMDFEADMMVKNPEEVAEKWIEAGAKALVLHIESTPKMLDLVKDLRKTYGYSGDSIVPLEIGIAIGIDTPNKVLDVFLEKNSEGRALADFVQFMGIKKIGYQGQPFDDTVLEKIADLRKKYPTVTISVDGGVNFDTYKDLVEAGANKLISGSALYESDNIKEAWNEMKNA